MISVPAQVPAKWAPLRQQRICVSLDSGAHAASGLSRCASASSEYVPAFWSPKGPIMALAFSIGASRRPVEQTTADTSVSSTVDIRMNGIRHAAAGCTPFGHQITEHLQQLGIATLLKADDA